MKLKNIKLPLGLKHSLWSVLDASLYPVVYLATVPVMLRSLGVIVFGVWIVINSIITILQLFNFNSGIASIGMATIRNFSFAKANNDIGQANDTINSVLHITFALFVIVIATGAFLSFATVRYGWFGLGEATGINVSLCVFLASVIAGLKFFDQVFQTVIKSGEHFKMSSMLNMFNRFGLLFINLALAIKGYSLVQMLSANIIFIVCFLLIEYVCIKKILPSYNIGTVKDRAMYKRLLGFSMLPWLQSLIIVCTFQSDRFWVSWYSGLREVSGYGLASTMFNHIHMIFTAMAIWMLPRVAGMTTRGENPARLYDVVRGFLLSFIVISLLFFYFIVPFIIRPWIGTDMYLRMFVYIKSFVAFEIVFAHTILPFFYLNAVGKEKLATIATFLYCGACYLFMVTALMVFHTPYAMVTGMTISLCITMPIVNIITHRHLHQIYSYKKGFLEMIPMYAAIIFIYFQNNMLLVIGLIALVTFSLWKYYLSNSFGKYIWQQIPKS